MEDLWFRDYSESESFPDCIYVFWMCIAGLRRCKLPRFRLPSASFGCCNLCQLTFSPYKYCLIYEYIHIYIYIHILHAHISTDMYAYMSRVAGFLLLCLLLLEMETSWGRRNRFVLSGLRFSCRGSCGCKCTRSSGVHVNVHRANVSGCFPAVLLPRNLA